VKHVLSALLGAATLLGAAPSVAQTTLTIATVNNGDMIRMQALTSEFTAKNPDIAVKWVTLEENVLRQRVTTDIATKGGQFDVLTIGTYEVPIWAKKNWLIPLDNLGPDYDTADLLPKIRDAASVSGKLYAAPFYGESSMVMYRTDLFQKAGLTMPEKPTWDFVIDAAKKTTDKTAGVFGISYERCARIMLGAAIDFRGHARSLRRIVFCLFGKEPYDDFDRVLRELQPTP